MTLQREEIRKALEEAHQGLDSETLERMTDQTVANLYGGEAEYAERLKAEAETELEEDYSGPDYTEEFNEEISKIKNIDAAVHFERLKAMHINSGYSEPEAELLARQAVEGQFGDAIYEETPFDSETSRQLEALERTVYLEEGDKHKVAVLMKLEGLNALEAYKKLNEQVRVRERMEEAEYQALSDREKEFYELLTPSDRRILRNLQAAQPDSGWTAEKLWRSLNEGKRKPRRQPEAEPEPTVSWEKYERETKLFQRAKEKLLAAGFHPDELEATLAKLKLEVE
jgi:hypothetical protein